MITFIEAFVKELQEEAIGTRKMLALVPNDKLDYKPHEKSMVLKMLATHIAEIPTWITLVLNSTELDFGKEPYDPKDLHSSEELLAYYNANVAEAVETLRKYNDAALEESWTMRSGETIFMTSSKLEAVRHGYCQQVHHRAQLGVYLRLLNIPIPGVYGPSADEQYKM